VGYVHEWGPQNFAGKPVVPTIWFDPKYPMNYVAAVVHRVGREMPTPVLDVELDIEAYGRALIMTICPLSDEDIGTARQWLREGSYPFRRQCDLAELRTVIDTMVAAFSRENVAKNNSFIKREPYYEGKNPRAINSYTDELKIFLGPIIHAMDKRLFQLKWFTKYMDPKDLPHRLKRIFGTSAVRETDFSNMEAHLRGVFARLAIYYFMHMLRGTTFKGGLKRVLCRLIRGTNTMVFGKPWVLKAQLDECMMSGALWTSSMNGLINLIIMSYLALRSADRHSDPRVLVSKLDSFVAVIEGDDGMTTLGADDSDLIRALGLQLKFKVSPDFGQAHFCGCICDSEELIRLKDPVEWLGKFFVLPPEARFFSERKRLAYMRSRALSSLYLYQGCPIIGKLAYLVCERTKSITCSTAETDYWSGRVLDYALKSKCWMSWAEPTSRSRERVAELYGIGREAQLLLEDSIGKKVRFEWTEGAGGHLHDDENMRYVSEHLYVPTSVEPKKVVVAPRRRLVLPHYRPQQGPVARAFTRLFEFEPWPAEDLLHPL